MFIAIAIKFLRLQILVRKKNCCLDGIGTHGLCVSAVVLHLLSYEDPYVESRPNYWVHPYPWQGWDVKWTAGIRMKLRCDHRSCDLNLYTIANFRPKNTFRASTGFKRMASALALRCSTNWVMKTHMLAADQFIEFVFTRDRNDTWNEVNLNCGNTDEIEMWSSEL